MRKSQAFQEFPTVPYRSLPFPTVPYRSLPFPTVPYRSLPFPTVPYRCSIHCCLLLVVLVVVVVVVPAMSSVRYHLGSTLHVLIMLRVLIR
jgi:hypothetical protein